MKTYPITQLLKELKVPDDTILQIICREMDATESVRAIRPFIGLDLLQTSEIVKKLKAEYL